MSDDLVYAIGTPVKINLFGDLRSGYITRVYPPVTTTQVHLYDVKLFKGVDGVDKLERISYIWFRGIGEGDR